MKTIKITLAAQALMICSIVQAEPRLFDEKSVIAEIEKMVNDNYCESGKEVAVTVFFSVSDDNKIQSVAVASEDEHLNEMIEKKLANQELAEENWRKGKIYELAVVKRS